MPFALVLLLLGCQPGPISDAVHPLSGLPREVITLKDTSANSIEILAEIADEPEAHAQGLMFREALPEGEGMLFIFAEEAPRQFWMKNTLIPLDILFLDAAGTLVSYSSMIPCTGDPCPLTASVRPAKFALEMPSGFIEKEGVGEGWRLVRN